jgi:hypothetical protein
MNKLWIALLLVFAPCFAQGQITEKTVNEMGKNGQRYVAVQPFVETDWSVFGSQPRYDPNYPEMLNGFQKSTAGELGISEVLDEVGNDEAAPVRLVRSEVVLYKGNQFYLDNCRWFINGQWVGFKNRIKPITPPPGPTPTPTPCPTVTEVKLPPPPEEVPLTELPPLPEEWQPDEVLATIVWDEHHRPRWSKFPVLNCVYQFGPGIKRHSKRDMVEKGLCFAGIAGGITAAVSSTAIVGCQSFLVPVIPL